MIARCARSARPPADDALPRRGGAARRPRRGPREGPSSARGCRGADWRNSETEVRYRRDGQDVVVRTHEPTKLLHELTRRRSPREASSKASRCAGRRSRTSTSSRRTRTNELGLASAAREQLSSGAAARPRCSSSSFRCAVRPAYRGLQRPDLRPPRRLGLLAGMLGYGAANTASPDSLSSRRTPRNGVLKRIRSTPLPAAAYLTAVLFSILIVFAVQAASLFVLGRS